MPTNTKKRKKTKNEVSNPELPASGPQAEAGNIQNFDKAEQERELVANDQYLEQVKQEVFRNLPKQARIYVAWVLIPAIWGGTIIIFLLFIGYLLPIILPEQSSWPTDRQAERLSDVLTALKAFFIGVISTPLIQKIAHRY